MIHTGKQEKAFFTRKFKGRCDLCGKWGHKKANCWENPNNDNKRNNNNNNRNNNNNNNGYNNGNDRNNNRRRFNGKCNYCGIIGHKEADCRKKKRKQGQHNNNEQANQAQEVVLMAGQLYCSKCNDIDDTKKKELALKGEQF